MDKIKEEKKQGKDNIDDFCLEAAGCVRQVVKPGAISKSFVEQVSRSAQKRLKGGKRFFNFRFKIIKGGIKNGSVH